MTFFDSITTCFAKYADFKGRASRAEFWWWQLFVVLALIAASIASPKLASLLMLAFVVPSWAVGCRRFHDINKSGWLQLVSLVPFVGPFIAIYWLVQDPVEPNQFGERRL